MARRTFPSAMTWIVRMLRPIVMIVTRRDWRGFEKLPEGGFVLAANHVSHTDPVLLGHFLVDNGIPPRYLAKASLFSVPVVGRIIRAAGQIPVSRGTGDAATAFAAAVAAVEAGEAVIFYPEGTITRDPQLWPMAGRSGAARVSLTTGCPVVPLAQWGPQAILAPYARRPRLFPRRTISIRVGEPVHLDDLRVRTLDDQVLEEASERILTAITALLAEIRGEEPPAVRYDLRTEVRPLPGQVRPVLSGPAPSGPAPPRRHRLERDDEARGA